MVKKLLSTLFMFTGYTAFAQTNPAITSWLQNTTIKGRHYVSGNTTPITDNNNVANVQTVQYSSNYVYISTQGIPAYITGPYFDGNPSNASVQGANFKFPLHPTSTTSFSSTTGGNIGIFINGVALFDYRDGVSWSSTSNTLKGGPLGGNGDGVWNRDAIVGERLGFDCSKGHPAMGNYHHHQNPSAFKLDLNIISTVCSFYTSDGLYTLDSTKHSPLLGFAYDGFPIYGAYAYKNSDGSGGIARMKSSFTLRSITVRNQLYTGASVSSGPGVNTTYPLGYFKEDYQYTAPTASDYLDYHNGRFCVTPEYPNGIYCYFTTVDKNWNSAYPYAVGPTFYGVYSNAKYTSAITESVTTYTSTAAALSSEDAAKVAFTMAPNPASDMIAVQINEINRENIKIELYDLMGRLVQSTTLFQGSTMAYFDTRTLYAGEYIVRISGSNLATSKRVTVID